MPQNLSEEQLQLINYLREHYFIFPRDYWKTVIGGAFAFLLAVGVISFGSAKSVLESSVAKTATEDISALHKDALRDTRDIATFKNGMLSGSAIRLQEVESDGEVGLTELQTDKQGFGLVRLPAGKRGLRFRLRFN